jgi:hypothetical protein
MAIVDVSPFQDCVSPATHHHTHAKVNTSLKNTTTTTKSQKKKDNETVAAINKAHFLQSLPFSLQPRHNPRNTLFREFYDAGEIPIAVSHGGGSNAVTWRVDPASLDYHRYLPLFFDGIREIDHPYRLLSVQGTKQLLAVRPEKVADVLPQVILPMQNALKTRDAPIVAVAMDILRHLATCEKSIGPMLVPYYRQLLPILNVFRNCDSLKVTLNVLSDGSKRDGKELIGKGRSAKTLRVLVKETLRVLERVGGEDALINIKYMVPTYESCVLDAER